MIAIIETVDTTRLDIHRGVPSQTRQNPLSSIIRACWMIRSTKENNLPIPYPCIRALHSQQEADNISMWVRRRDTVIYLVAPTTCLELAQEPLLSLEALLSIL